MIHIKPNNPEQLIKHIPHHKPEDLIFLEVEKEFTDTGNTSPLTKFFKVLTRDPFKMRNSINIFFSGYDSDPRPIHFIPKIISFYHKAIQEIPYMVMFIKYNPPKGNEQLNDLAVFIRMILLYDATKTNDDHSLHITKGTLISRVQEQVNRLPPFFDTWKLSAAKGNIIQHEILEATLNIAEKSIVK